MSRPAPLNHPNLGSHPFAFFAKGETTAVCDFPDVPTQGFSTARMVSRSARNDRSNEGAPSLRLRSGQARVSHVFWRDRAGDFDFIGPVREVKIPTLPHRTREGWGTRVLLVTWKSGHSWPRSASRDRPLEPGRTPDAQTKHGVGSRPRPVCFKLLLLCQHNLRQRIAAAVFR